MHFRLTTVLALVLALRSLLPANYMPSFSPSGISIVICSAKGLKVVTIDDNGDVKEGHGSRQVGEPCAFSGLAVVALVPPEGPAIVPASLATAGPLPDPGFLLPPIRAGPTLGSRAPPLNS